jgi:hypothetical protein
MPKNNEQSATNITQNKPNQTQFQTHNHLAQLASRQIATFLHPSQRLSGGETVRAFDTRAGLLCEALRRLAKQRSPCYLEHGQDARATMTVPR